MCDSITLELFSGLRLSKFWQIVCGPPSETVVHILVFAVSLVTLPLRTIILNIFKVSPSLGILLEHEVKPSLYTCMKASLLELGPVLNRLMYLSEGLGICASTHPRLNPDVGADSAILEIASCFPENASLFCESNAKALS